MSNYLFLLLSVQLFTCNCFNLNLAIQIEDGNNQVEAGILDKTFQPQGAVNISAETSLIPSLEDNTLMESLAQDLDQSYQDLTKCGFSKVVRWKYRIYILIYEIFSWESNLLQQ